MDTLEYSMPNDVYDTVITVNRASLSILVGRTIEPNEWHHVCRRKDCMSCGRDANGDFLETTFTAHDLHCYMIGSTRALSKLLWHKLVDSQNIDEAFYIDKFGSGDLYSDVMDEITHDVFDASNANPDKLKYYWE